MRRLAAILALVLGLTSLAAPPASAAVAASAENRASGSAATPDHLVGIEPRLSEEAVRENVGLGYDLASDDAVAARGVGRATTDFIDNVTVVSKGKVLGRGTVDVRATVEGIQSGRLSPRNVFRNDEGLLPPRRTGYYQEFYHPTPGHSGIGPERIVRGQGGELYYTPDHYGSFIPLN